MVQLSDEELISELQSRFEQNKKTLLELNRLNKILTKVNDQLSEAEAMKSHFISNISNEIVNPFTSILVLSKSILEAEKESWKKVISMVSLIHIEAFNLDFQFKNIFAAAKIEAGEVSLEISKVNIFGVLEELTESFKYEIKRKRLQVAKTINNENSDAMNIKSDAGKIKLILSNLLSNAIRFSPEGGTIKINSYRKNKNLVCEIHDQGMGISKENQEIIFDRFKKLDSGISSMNRGHGLGLSIIKAYLELMEGNIEIDSTPGKGSKFAITIPESEGMIEGYSLNGNEVFFEEDLN